MILIWLQLMCLAGSVNDYGRVYLTEEIPYTEQMLATAFGEPLPTVQMALKIFEQFNMIEVVDDIIYISFWEKYQSVDGMEKVREQTRKRVASYREKQKLISNVTSNVTVTHGNAIDKDIDKELDKENINNNRFKKPDIEAVKAYCKEKNILIDADYFVNYYESKGWKVGKAPMKDWKAAVRNWARNDKAWGNKQVFENPYNQDNGYDNEDAMRRLFNE